MCLILVAWQAHPTTRWWWPPTGTSSSPGRRPAGWWQDAPDVFAGRDLEAGGTWLGLSRAGRFAGLTNFRDPQRNRAGALPRGPGGGFPRQHRKHRRGPCPAAARRPRYNAFNLFVSDGDTLGIYESESGAARLLEPGVHALSNHLLDTPWPKVRAGKARLFRALQALPDDTPLVELLRDDRPAPDAELPAPASAWPGSGCCRAPSSAPPATAPAAPP
jgi:uncharacterized protein with NRDE domain